MQNPTTSTGQQVIYFIVSPFTTTATSFTAIFTSTSTPQNQIYSNQLKAAVPKGSQGQQIQHFHQQDHEVVMEDSILPSPKVIRQKKEPREYEEYNPRREKSKMPSKKVYEKDKLRNILPNALSKLFFFMKSTGKSESLLIKILQTNQKLGKYVTPSIYYAYHKFMKQKMERFLTADSLKYLFIVNDPENINFSLESQLAIVKINAIIIRNFLKNSLYLQILLNSPRSPKDKISAYINKYRIIEERAQQIMEQTKKLYRFDQILK